MTSVLRRAAGLFGLLAVLLACTGTATAHEAHRQRAEARAAAAQAGGDSAAAAPAQAEASAEVLPGHHGAMAGMVMDSDMEMTPLERRQQMTFLERLSDWLGRWHRSIVHFPIALILVALGLEAWAVIRRKPAIVAATRILIALGALSAVAAAFLGWTALGLDVSQDDWIHRYHRILGTTVPVLALGAWYFRERSVHESGAARRLPYRILLTLSGLAVAVNGFLGGSMEMGIDHLAW